MTALVCMGKEEQAKIQSVLFSHRLRAIQLPCAVGAEISWKGRLQVTQGENSSRDYESGMSQ